LFLLSFILVAFAWQSLTILRRIPLTDALVIGLVTIVTVMSDLAVAVIVSALAYAWSNAVMIKAKTDTTDEGAKGYQV